MSLREAAFPDYGVQVRVGGEETRKGLNEVALNHTGELVLRLEALILSVQ